MTAKTMTMTMAAVAKSLVIVLLAILIFLPSTTIGKNQKEITNIREEDVGKKRKNDGNGVAFSSSSSSSSSSSVALDSNGDLIPLFDSQTRKSSSCSRSNDSDDDSDDNNSVSFNNWVPLHKSKIWTSTVAGGLQEEDYYQPNCANMNLNIAYSYFNLFSGFIDDGLERLRGPLLALKPSLSSSSSSSSSLSSSHVTRHRFAIDPSEKVYILELGANSGKFGFHFLMALQAQGEYLGIPTERIVYIITDRSRRNIDRIRRERSMQPYLASGQLILMHWDWSHPIAGVDDDDSLSPPLNLKESFIRQLKDSCNHCNQSTQLDEFNSFPGVNPLFVISNFFLSSLSWDVFKTNRGGLFEEVVMDISSATAAEYLDDDGGGGGGGGGGGDLMFDLAFAEAAPDSYYSNTTSRGSRAVAGLANSDLLYLDQMLRENHIDRSSRSNDQSNIFGIPIGAFKLLRGLCNLTNGGNFLLTYIENTTTASIMKYEMLQYLSTASVPRISFRSLARSLTMQEDEIEKFVRYLGGGSLSNKEATGARIYKGQVTEDKKMCQPGSLFLFPVNGSDVCTNDCVFRNMGGAFHDNFVKFSPLETLRLYNQTKLRPHKVEKKASHFAEGRGGRGEERISIIDDFNYVFWSLSIFRWDPDLLLSLAPILIRNQLLLEGSGDKVQGRGSGGEQLEKLSEFRNIGHILQKSYSSAYFEATKINFARIIYQLLLKNDGYVVEGLLAQSYFAVLFDLFGVGNPTVEYEDAASLSWSLLLSLSNVTADMGGEERRRRDELFFLKVKYFEMIGEIDLSLNLLEEYIFAHEDDLVEDEMRRIASMESLALWNKIVDHRNRFAIRHSRSKSTAFSSFIGNDGNDDDDDDNEDSDDDYYYNTRDSITEDVYLNAVHPSDSYIECCSASPTELTSCSKSVIKPYTSSSHQRVKKIESAPGLFALSTDSNRRQKRIAIITYAANSKTNSYFKYSSIINGAYCDVRGYRFIAPPVVDNSVLFEIDPDWIKVYLLKKFMESKQNMRSFDYIMWVDPDFIFTDFNRSLEEIVSSAIYSEGKHLFISAYDYDEDTRNDYSNNRMKKRQVMKKKQMKKKRLLYTGSFIMKTSVWSLNFLKDWWGRSVSENARNIKRFKNSRNEEGKLDELYLITSNSNKIAVLPSNNLGSFAHLYREKASFALYLRGEIPHVRSEVLASAFKSLCSRFQSNYEIDRDENDDIANYFDSDGGKSLFGPIVKRSELLAIASESYETEMKKRNGFMIKSSARSVSATFLVETDIVYRKLCEFTQLISDSKHDRSCNSLYLLQLDVFKTYFLQKNFSAVTESIATLANAHASFDEVLTKAPEYTALIVTMVDLFNRLAIQDGIDLHLKLDLSNSQLLIYETLKKYSAFSTTDLSLTTNLIYTSMIRSFRVLIEAKSYDRAHSYLNTLTGYVIQYEVILGCTKEVEVTLYRLNVMLLQHIGRDVGDKLLEANELLLFCEQKVFHNRKYVDSYFKSHIDRSAKSDSSSVFGSHNNDSSTTYTTSTNDTNHTATSTSTATAAASTLLETSTHRTVPIVEEYTNYPTYVSLDTIFVLQGFLKALNATYLKQSQNVISKLCLENFLLASEALAKVDDPSTAIVNVDLDLYELTIKTISNLNSCRLD